MTTKTINLTKNENNDFIDANTVTIELSEQNIQNIAKAVKSMTDISNQIRISIEGEVKWLKDGQETDDRIDYEEFVVFKDGEMTVIGVEKYNTVEIESNLFEIDEVTKIIQKDDSSSECNEGYCNFCCMESTFDEQNNCEICGNLKSIELSEKDEEINNLASENKNMALSLTNLGFTQEQISAICVGSFGMLKAWIDVENTVEDTEYIINVAIVDIVSSKTLSTVHEYRLISETGANTFIEKINNSKLLTLNDAIFIYDDITNEELNF